jgi:hypothetical protein
MRFIKHTYYEISILKLAPELGIHKVGNKAGMSFSRINYWMRCAGIIGRHFFFFHIRTVHLDIIKVLFIQQLMN